jgi:hypothetical protein
MATPLHPALPRVNPLPFRHAIAFLVTGRDDRLAAAEIDALERLGQPVLRVVPPPFSARMALHVALRFVRRRSLASPRAIDLAETLRARGIRHVHAWDDRAARLAGAMARAEGVPFSCSDAVSERLRSGALFVVTRGDAAALLARLESSGPPHMLDRDWSGFGATSIGVRWISTRYDAAVAEIVLHTPEGARPMIVKHHRQDERFGQAARERARREHQALILLDRSMFGAHRVPRVVAFDEDRTTILMERAAGTSLDALLHDPATRGEAFENAGGWLRAMQTATRSASDPRALLASTLEQSRRDLVTLAKRDHVIRRHARRITRVLEQGVSVPFVAGHHGDYWPGNIFTDDESVTVIDLEGYREGLPLEDVAYFLMRTELLGGRFRIAVGEVRDRFLRGYGDAPDVAALRLFTVIKTLRTLMNHTATDLALSLPVRLWTWRMLRQSLVRALR